MAGFGCPPRFRGLGIHQSRKPVPKRRNEISGPDRKRSRVARLIGYARVSADARNRSLQLAALKQASCPARQIFRDTISGARSDRFGRPRYPGLSTAKAARGMQW